METRCYLSTYIATKKIFIEPQEASQVEEVLELYYNAIYPKNITNFGNVTNVENNKNDRVKGAILLCVVGGKLSEGINFKDELARCVIMVGLPYPNPANIELKLRMQYLKDTLGNNEDKAYYENLCMRAVNQSIGRAIRHINDFGIMLLIDHRYCNRQNIIENIPKWIQKSLSHCLTFSNAFQLIQKFIMNMKTFQTNVRKQ